MPKYSIRIVSQTASVDIDGNPTPGSNGDGTDKLEFTTSVIGSNARAAARKVAREWHPSVRGEVLKSVTAIAAQGWSCPNDRGDEFTVDVLSFDIKQLEAAVHDRLEAIAGRHLGFVTLDTRNSDSLDFREVSVWDVKWALANAFAEGVKMARAVIDEVEGSNDVATD